MFTNLLTPTERRTRRLNEEKRFDELRHSLKERYEPAVLYRAMLFVARARGKKDTIAYWTFLDMFGAKPRREDQRGDPVLLDDPEFAEWILIRDARSKRKWPAVKAKLKKEGKWRGKSKGESSATQDH